MPALQVFDDWKAAADCWEAAQQQHLPNLDSQEVEEQPAPQQQSPPPPQQQQPQQPAGTQAAAAAEAAPATGEAPSAADEAAPKAAAARAARAARAAAAAKLAGVSGAAPAAGAAGRSHPKLSYVTLAFLEACCRGEPEFEWRVYDVCAVMRQQKETKRQAGLARPQKASHHFAPA